MTTHDQYVKRFRKYKPETTYSVRSVEIDCCRRLHACSRTNPHRWNLAILSRQGI